MVGHFQGVCESHPATVRILSGWVLSGLGFSHFYQVEGHISSSQKLVQSQNQANDQKS